MSPHLGSLIGGALGGSLAKPRNEDYSGPQFTIRNPPSYVRPGLQITYPRDTTPIKKSPLKTSFTPIAFRVADRKARTAARRANPARTDWTLNDTVLVGTPAFHYRGG